MDRLYLPLVSVLAPPLLGGLLTWSWQGALTAFFWASLVRIALLHHVTWSINSICHVYGQRPFATRGGDRAANFWPLAIISFGESWHNSHHADPTCARHGVLRGQLDPSARLIWLLEKAGWVYDVRWPAPQRLHARRIITADEIPPQRGGRSDSQPRPADRERTRRRSSNSRSLRSAFIPVSRPNVAPAMRPRPPGGLAEAQHQEGFAALFQQPTKDRPGCLDLDHGTQR